MLAGVYDFTIEQGSVFRKSITWMSGDVIPVPFDLEGFFAKMQIRESANAIPIYT